MAMNFKTRTLTTLCTLGLAIGVPSGALAAVSWSSWVSEENGGPWSVCGPSNEAVSGFDCDDSYCDDVRVQCQTMPDDISVTSYNVSNWFSDEDSGIGKVTSVGWYRYDTDSSHVCNYSGSSGIMTGIRCDDSYCDDIQIECATPRRWVDGSWETVSMVDCSWTGWFSEEDPALTFDTGANRFVTGVRCRGSYCDDKSFYVCRLDVPTDSCGGECGGAASGCWCDAACQNYGDCCDDYQDVCVP